MSDKIMPTAKFAIILGLSTVIRNDLRTTNEIFIIRNHLEVHINSSLSELTRKWIYFYDY
jgi:hypothetical protein